MLLVSSDHRAEHLWLEDSCVHCAAPVRVAFEAGRVVGVQPSAALVFLGGG